MLWVSFRIILVVAKIKGFRICVVDVKLGYLKSEKFLLRKTFITKPAPELELVLEKYLKLFKKILDLAESVDEWHRALDDNV